MLTELTKNFATFGRASLDDGVEGFKFTQFENYSTATVSRTHFVITRESAASDANTNPPVVTCFSRNGMNVNSDELYKGQKRILLDGDIIKINATAVFVFHDLRLKRQQEHEYFPTRIRNKYFIGEFLGKGGYGTVQMIHNVKTFEKFAIKVVQLKLDKDGKPNAYKKRQIENEIDLMMSLNHPNLMSLIDRSERSRNMFLIMDLMDMDLLKYLLTLNGHLMFETPARLFFYQICKGVEHLHSKNIVHRDLKVDNILIKIHENSKQIQLRIGDFGFSKYDPEGMFYTQLGTECYTAPEILELLDDENSNAYTTQADVWSLGCILFMMLTGRFAFHSSYGGNVRDQIKAADFDRNLLEGVSLITFHSIIKIKFVFFISRTRLTPEN